MSGSYSFDTNAILVAWNEVYRPASFGGFWRNFEELVASARGSICEEVERELGKKDDAAHSWVKEQNGFVVPLEEEQVTRTRALASAHPVLAKERLGRMRADGFVIALAQWKGLTVVTAENRRGPEKIPNICEAVGVNCISLPDLIEQEGWTFP